MTPWHDAATDPPKHSKPVLVKLRSGHVTTGRKVDGKWLIDGRLVPATMIARWVEIPPDEGE